MSELTDRFARLLNQAGQVKPPRAPGLVPDISASETLDEEEAGQRLVADLLGTVVGIAYRDAAGAESRRQVTVRRVAVSGGGAVLLHCFCHERRAPRAFRADRIAHLWDIRTGEVKDDVAAALRRRYLPMLDGVESALSIFVREAAPEIAMLSFLGRADGSFALEERSVVLDYLGERGRLSAGGVDWLSGYLGRQYPEPATFADALKRTRMWTPEHRRRFSAALRALADADGELSAEEFDVARDIGAVLGSDR